MDVSFIIFVHVVNNRLFKLTIIQIYVRGKFFISQPFWDAYFYKYKWHYLIFNTSEKNI